MSKKKFTIDSISNEGLLYELLRRAGDDKLYFSDINSSPKKIEFVEQTYEVIIGIGRDNHAKIYLTQDDINALNDVLEIKAVD